MAILDKSLQLASGQSNVRAANTYVSTNVIDLGAARGTKIIEERGYLQVRVGSAYTGGTSVEFQLVCADDAAISSNVQILASSGAIVDAALTASTIVWETAIPQNIPKRYLAVRAVGVGAHTTGTHDINIAVGVQVGPY